MVNIVIIGAGFGGLQTALNLSKKDKNLNITLIDKRDYFLFTPNLYEVAASEEELTTMKQMEKSITLSLNRLLSKTKIKFLHNEVLQVLTKDKKVVLASRQVPYDYLVLALGSMSDFYNVVGVEKFANTLKSLPDALRIRNKIEFMVQAATMEMAKRTLRVVVAGGGYTGLELAAELKGLLDILAMKYGYPREKMELEIIEANNKVVNGFSDRLSQDAYSRLLDLGIRVRLSARICSVNEYFVELLNGEKVAYDCLIWTTGVKASPMPPGGNLFLDARGHLPVNGYLQVQEFENIFALGDFACVLDQAGKPVPATAQDAWDEAKFLVYSLPYIIKNQKPPKTYSRKQHGFIVSLGGKWAIICYNNFYAKGFIAYFINQMAHLRYYASVVGWFKAVRYIFFQVEIYSRND